MAKGIEMSLELLVIVGMCLVMAFYFRKLRESAGEVGGSAFGIDVRAGMGTRCELVDCSHNLGARLSARALRAVPGRSAPRWRGSRSTREHVP